MSRLRRLDLPLTDETEGALVYRVRSALRERRQDFPVVIEQWDENRGGWFPVEVVKL